MRINPSKEGILFSPAFRAIVIQHYFSYKKQTLVQYELCYGSHFYIEKSVKDS